MLIQPRTPNVVRKTVWFWYWPQVSIPLSIGKLLPSWLSGKESACQCRRHRRLGFDPWVGKIPWRRKWQCTPVFLPGKFHGQKSLAGYNPWGLKETDMTERTHTHTHTSVGKPEWLFPSPHLVLWCPYSSFWPFTEFNRIGNYLCSG